MPSRSRSLLRAIVVGVAGAAAVGAVAAGSASAAAPVAAPSAGAAVTRSAPFAAKSLAAQSGTQYQIAVHTGEAGGAGTDGDVWVWLSGTKGSSGWMYLDNSEDNFERNKTDYFHKTLADLGTLTRAYVYFRPGGWFSDWYLDTVTVNGTVFPAYRWLTNEGYVSLAAA